MADANPTHAPRPSATPPMAKPGFGKRSAPDQPLRRRGDFAHLPTREAIVATHIDRLPDGAAIDAKTLAKELPDYGQQAVRSALNALSEAGHLRRLSGTVDEGRTQWVTRTFFSRQPRDNAWWAAFAAGETPVPPAPAPAREPAPAPAPNQPWTPPQVQPDERPAPRPPRTPRSPAYDALAALGRTEPRMALSAAECADLEPLAAQWLARGTGPAHLASALTAGLPSEVHSPGALARNRLTAKMPPEPAEPPTAPAPRWIMECTDCGIPGRPEALPGGLCRTCRGEPPRPNAPALSSAEVHARAERLRAAART
ncbi:hypothetical protein ACQUSR_19495 [Streptomyces sp. P1-3]|uniref:hypothetical protein n=1 Tax=Streptomyces sp. P1-3 TaxID=3421658 RepID=UPI003D362644